MEEVIRLKTRWTLEQLLAAEDYSSYQLKISPLGRLGYCINALYIVISLIVLWILFKFFTLVLIVLLLVFMKDERRELRSLINSDNKMVGSKDIEVEWEIRQKRITAKLDDFADSDFSWNLISKIVQTQSGFTVYITDEIFYCLPNQAFLSKFDCQRFTELALAKEKLLVRE